MAIKTSKVMDRVLAEMAEDGGGWLLYGVEAATGTIAALMDRKLIGYGQMPNGTRGHYLAEAGWAHLGLERPRHAAGRYILAEALEAAYEDEGEDDEVQDQTPLEEAASKIYTIAAEDFRPGYRYWPVREGYEAAWTIAAVTLSEGENQVYRDGKWITPVIVTHTRRDGDTRRLDLGEQIAVQGPWKTDN
jgi:hypothetical protein